MKWLVVLCAVVVCGCGKKDMSKYDDQTIIFQRATEPKEKAFSVLVPLGWKIEGGIVRIDPSVAGGPAQSIAAKVDFTVKKDKEGSVMMRWLPDYMYFDASRSPAGQMGMMQEGSIYQGMIVSRVLTPFEFIMKEAIPYAHGQINNLQITSKRPMPTVAQRLSDTTRTFMPGLKFTYNASVVDMTYDENGITYQERMMVAVEDWGEIGVGLWGNKESLFMRAPAEEFEQSEPIFSIIQQSVQINPKWMADELKGQQTRLTILKKIQDQIQDIDRQIVEHRQKTNAEIHNDMFLTLMEQEEYENPYTGETEVGSDQWKHRWVNESGEVIYTDYRRYNPNHDERIKRSDFKRTPVRKR